MLYQIVFDDGSNLNHVCDRSCHPPVTKEMRAGHAFLIFLAQSWEC